MSYNSPASKDSALYRLGGYLACLALHPRSVRSFLRTFYSKRAWRSDVRPLRISPFSGTNWPCCCTRIPTRHMKQQANVWACRGVRSDVGASGGPRGILPWQIRLDEAARPFFPPLDHALVKAVACELVAETKQPLSRQSLADVTTRVQQALGKPVSRSTV
jgi:hypothetical protein